MTSFHEKMLKREETKLKDGIRWLRRTASVPSDSDQGDYQVPRSEIARSNLPTKELNVVTWNIAESV
jgi:hypothetical protein